MAEIKGVREGLAAWRAEREAATADSSEVSDEASVSSDTGSTGTPTPVAAPPTPSTGTGGTPDDQGGTAVTASTLTDEELEAELESREVQRERDRKAAKKRKEEAKKARIRNAKKVAKKHGFKLVEDDGGKKGKKDKKDKSKKSASGPLFELNPGQSRKLIPHLPPGLDVYHDNGDWVSYTDPENPDIFYVQGTGEEPKTVMATRSYYGTNHATLVGMVKPGKSGLVDRIWGIIAADSAKKDPAATS